MSAIQIHITLQQLNEWSRDTFGFDQTSYKVLESFVSTMEMFPPRGLQSHVRGLIVDEAVDPEDIVFWLMDDSTDELHHFNPKLAEIFKGVYIPVSVDPSVLENII
tara:strand:- start:94 stop:411 length:318 start_codon:yes stop_codon:yes gene_type:complete